MMEIGEIVISHHQNRFIPYSRPFWQNPSAGRNKSYLNSSLFTVIGEVYLKFRAYFKYRSFSPYVRIPVEI